jgi:hypothetical protein
VRKKRGNLIVLLTAYAVLAEAEIMFAQVQLRVTHLSAVGLTVAESSPTNASDLNRLLSAFTSNLIRWDRVKDLPFTATGRIVLERSLPDGTTVSNSYQVSCWRDSSGRRRSEYVIKSPHSNRKRRMVTVWDPVNRNILNWTSGNQTDYVVSLSHVSPTARLQNSIGDPPDNHMPKANYENIHTENLPSNMIAGLHVEGVRTTWTIPNDHDITVTAETWISHELKIIVRQIMDDPRSGKVITELTKVDRSNPAPALFHPPQGYTIEDFPPKHLNF